MLVAAVDWGAGGMSDLVSRVKVRGDRPKDFYEVITYPPPHCNGFACETVQRSEDDPFGK